MFCHEKWIPTTISNSNSFATSMLKNFFFFFPPNSKISLTSNFIRKMLHTQHLKKWISIMKDNNNNNIIVFLNANNTKGKKLYKSIEANQLSMIELHLSPQYVFGSKHPCPFLKHITHFLFVPNANFLSDSKLRRSKARLLSWPSKERNEIYLDLTSQNTLHACLQRWWNANLFVTSNHTHSTSTHGKIQPSDMQNEQQEDQTKDMNFKSIFWLRSGQK